MKRKFTFKKTLLLLLPLLLLIIVFEPFLSPWWINQCMDIAGVKLLMSKAEVDHVLGEAGIELGGMGARFFKYEKAGITISLPQDGLFSGRVSSIDTSDPKHGVLGVHPGSTIEKNQRILGRNGFWKFGKDEEFYRRGSIVISLYGSLIRVSVSDWTLMGRVY
jgi:hypothetical protein